jgi:hypothetical protein
VPDSPWLLNVASRVPMLFGGAWLHRSALAATHAESFELAERLFEAAASLYREDLEVEALARLRTQQAIARYRAGRFGAEADVARLEIERRLARWGAIESLSPPFEIVPTHYVSASWTRRGRRRAGDTEEAPRLEDAA